MKSKIFIVLMLVGHTLMGSEFQPFIGIDMSKTYTMYDEGLDGTLTVNYGGGAIATSIDNKIYKYTSENKTIGMQVGINIDNSHRVYFYHTNFSMQEGMFKNTTDLMTLNYDYLFEKDNNFTPYIGIHAGQSKLEVLDKQDKGFMYGLQIGTLYQVTKNFELELRGTYSQLNTKITDTSIVSTSNLGQFSGDASIELQSLTKISIGFNVKF